MKKSISYLNLKNKKLYIFGLIFSSFLYIVSSFLTPRISGDLINNVVEKKNIYDITQTIIIFFLVCLGQPTFMLLKEFISLNFTQCINLELKDCIFKKVINNDYRFLENKSKGEVLNIFSSDIFNITTLITQTIPNIALYTTFVIFVIIGMFLESYIITFIILVLISISFIIQYLHSKHLEQLSHKTMINADSYHYLINETLNNILIIKADKITNKYINMFKENTKISKLDNIKKGKKKIFLSSTSEIITIFSICIIYSFGVIQTLNGAMTIGQVVTLGFYFQMISTPIMMISESISDYKEFYPSIQRINSLVLDHVYNQNNVIYQKGDHNKIEIKDLTFNYGNDNNTFTNFNLTINGNGFFCVKGASGCGKSTLFKILLNLYTIDKGNINITYDKKCKSAVSYCPQYPLFINDTIENNLFINTDKKENDLLEKINELRLADMVDRFDLGLKTIMNENTHLSGGESKRLSILKTLLSDSPILLFDEPISSLDFENRNTVMKYLKSCAKNKLIIVINHYDEYDYLFDKFIYL